jgi:hypothetical protein
MYMVMFVLNDADKLDALLDAWLEIRISGVTIVESTGFFRRQIQRSKLHLTFLVEPISSGAEQGNLTLFTAVDNDALVQQCLAKTEEVVGDLTGPSTGVFTAWPLTIAKGIRKHANGEGRSR